MKLPKCSAVIHLAAIASVIESIDNPLFVNDVNVNGTLNMLEFCRKKKIKNSFSHLQQQYLEITSQKLQNLHQLFLQLFMVRQN